MTTADYYLSKSLASIGITNQKERAFTKAPMAQDIVWKQAYLAGGAEFPSAFKRDVATSKQLDLTLGVGVMESICPWTLQAHYKVNFTVGVTDITQWDMVPFTTANGNPAAGRTDIKPISGPAAAAANGVTDAGITVPKMLFALQFHKIQPMQQSDKLWTASMYSNSRSIGNTIEHAVLTEYVNGPGQVDRAPRCRNDWTSVVPDEYFSFQGDRKIMAGGSDTAITLTEKVPMHITHRRNAAFSVSDSQSDSYRLLPPGCNVKLICQTRASATERLKVGQCLVWTGAAWSVPQDVFVNFLSCELFYHAVVEWPTNWSLSRQLPILGQESAAVKRGGALVDASTGTSSEGYETPMVLTGAETNMARYTLCDPVQRKFPLTQGDLSKLIKLNDSPNDVMPSLVLMYIGKETDFTAEMMASTNASLLNFGVDNVGIKKVTPSIGSGPSDKCPFMDMYPGNDINDDSPLEMQVMDDISGGSLVCPFFRWDDSLLAKQAVFGHNAWQARRAALGLGKLPYEKMKMFVADISSAVCKDASNGADASTLQFNIDFSIAIPGQDYVMYVFSFFRHNFVLSLKNTDVKEVPQYTVNTGLSRLAFGAKG